MPLRTALGDLVLLATIRGALAEAARVRNALDLAAAANAVTDTDIAALVATSPPDSNSDSIQVLEQAMAAGSQLLRFNAIADLPRDLQWLLNSGAVTVAQLAELHGSIELVTAADLQRAVDRQRIRALGSWGADAERRIAAAMRDAPPAPVQTPIGRVAELVVPVVQLLAETDGVIWVEPVGSLRRGDDLIGDIELIAPTRTPIAALDRVAAAGDVLSRGVRHASIRIDRTQLTVRCPSPDDAGALILGMTGDAIHLQALQERAAHSGGRLDVDGLMTRGGSRIAASEAAIYEALRLPLIPPELRQGDEAIRAADAGTLPLLISRADIRGDLHLHSHWSDGRDTIEAMVTACLALGYEYLAVTDHSPHSAASRNLSVESVERQRDEIAALRDRYPQIAILHGCEVDILADGHLDFSDQILERFDIVLASLHDAAGHSPRRLLARYRSAMHHPLVTIVTHPANRMVPLRRGYDLDFEQLFELAANSGTVLEIDGAPSHLDLDSTRARQAVAAGVCLSIDSDSHRASALARQMALGVTIARRAWVQAGDVLNTRPLAGVRAVIAAKRAG